MTRRGATPYAASRNFDVEELAISHPISCEHQRSWFWVFEIQTREGLHSESSEFVKHILNASRPDLMAFAFALQETVAIGRFLLILAAISVLTSPLTQDIWTWDHFLRGGQDFETETLTIVIILCLAVLLSQLCKKHIELLFTVRPEFAFAFSHGELPGTSFVRSFFIFRTVRANGAAIDRYSLPLKK
jgi:hypothetical protein